MRSDVAMGLRMKIRETFIVGIAYSGSRARLPFGDSHAGLKLIDALRNDNLTGRKSLIDFRSIAFDRPDSDISRLNRTVRSDHEHKSRLRSPLDRPGRNENDSLVRVYKQTR